MNNQFFSNVFYEIIEFVIINYSAILATLAFIISLISLIYTFYQNKKYKPKLNIVLEKRHSCMILRPCSNYPGSKANCVVRLSIINESAFPITIYKITDGENYLCNEVVTHKTGLYIRQSNNSTHTLNLTNQIKLPIRLDSYDAFSGPIFFSNFRVLLKDDTFTIFIFTSRGKFTKEIKVTESFATKEQILRTGI